MSTAKNRKSRIYIYTLNVKSKCQSTTTEPTSPLSRLKFAIYLLAKLSHLPSYQHKRT